LAVPKRFPKRSSPFAGARPQWKSSLKPWKRACRQVRSSILAYMAGFRGACVGFLSLLALTKPLDPLSDLAQALKAHSATPIDDDDGDDDETPIEKGFDREPGEA
jgi:hypothetical protein